MKNRLMLLVAVFMLIAVNAFAQNSDPLATTTTFTDKMLEIIQGPITKFMAAVILLGGVGALLRGRHKMAISCGIAFIVLLSIPLLIPHN
jgi:type IV secretory pathway VirB2 component (pilin)